MKSNVIDLEINRVTVKHALREDAGDLTSLKKSIGQLGLLHPLIVDRDNVLISGSRRLAACKMTGKQTVRVIKLDTTYNSMMALDVLADENLCRRALTAVELEKLIQAKKTCLAGKTPQTAGVFSRIKQVLRRD